MQSVTSNAVNEALKNGMCVGSCVLWNEPMQLIGTQDVKVLGAYADIILNFSYIDVPTGFHKEYVLSAQVTTGGDAFAFVKLNNISTELQRTWSGPSFRAISTSKRFKTSDIEVEPTYLYEHTVGTNLHLCSFDQTGNDNIVSTIYGVTLSCFLVRD